MAKLRSPNYPNRNLEAALGFVQVIYSKDGRNKVSRMVVANHMGHETLTGPALGKIGALRAYGLIEGTGDELRVTEDAIAALMAPLGSDARRDAIRRLALNPTLFQDIRKEFTGKVSVESLTYWLIQNGFLPAAAPIAARTYFETMEFAGGLEPDGSSAGNVPEVRHESRPSLGTPIVPKQQGIGGMTGERVAFIEEGNPGQYLKLIVSGEVDDTMLEALEDFVKRQRKRLLIMETRVDQVVRPAGVFEPGEEVPVSGNYWASHPNEHVSAGNIMLNKGEKFPHCNVCGNAVIYKQRGINENAAPQ